MEAKRWTQMILSVLLVSLLNSCGMQLAGVNLSTSAPPIPSPIPTPVEPEPVPTQLPAHVEGAWKRFTQADGFCTDRPYLIGHWYIGTQDTAICHPECPAGQYPCRSDQARWIVWKVPIGKRVTSAAVFPPGGGLEVTTDEGVCFNKPDPTTGSPQWRCQTQADGFPYKNVRGLTSLGTEPVYRLTDTVAYAGTSYSIPKLTGKADARTTWVVVSGQDAPFPLLWVGTSNSGVVVVEPRGHSSWRYTTANGLPSDVVRDICTEPCGNFCDLQPVWVATDKGVARWNGRQWTSYDMSDGLPSDDVRGVSSGGTNTVWATTAAGVAYFNGFSWQVFTRADGLPEGDLSGVILAWPGEVWFSTRGNGLIVLFLAQ